MLLHHYEVKPDPYRKGWYVPYIDGEKVEGLSFSPGTALASSLAALSVLDKHADSIGHGEGSAMDRIAKGAYDLLGMTTEPLELEDDIEEDQGDELDPSSPSTVINYLDGMYKTATVIVMCHYHWDVVLRDVRRRYTEEEWDYLQSLVRGDVKETEIADLPFPVTYTEFGKHEMIVEINHHRYYVDCTKMKDKTMSSTRIVHLIWLLWWHGYHAQHFKRKPKGRYAHDPVLMTLFRVSGNMLGFEENMHGVIERGYRKYTLMPIVFYNQGEKIATKLFDRISDYDADIQYKMLAAHTRMCWVKDKVTSRYLESIEVDMSDMMTTDIKKGYRYALILKK